MLFNCAGILGVPAGFILGIMLRKSAAGVGDEYLIYAAVMAIPALFMSFTLRFVVATHWHFALFFFCHLQLEYLLVVITTNKYLVAQIILVTTSLPIVTV